MRRSSGRNFCKKGKNPVKEKKTKTVKGCDCKSPILRDKITQRGMVNGRSYNMGKRKKQRKTEKAWFATANQKTPQEGVLEGNDEGLIKKLRTSLWGSRPQ